MSDDFERMILGAGGNNNNPTSGNDARRTSDTPAFLMDDPPLFSNNTTNHNTNSPSGSHAAGGSPAFLEGLADPDAANNNNNNNGGRHAPSAGARSDRLLDNERQQLDGVSSAERLDFVGESGYRWVLARERILGKGTFGCATLYSQDAAALAACGNAAAANGNARHAGRRASGRVVVKDVNMQTMSNKAEEMAALRTEVEVLRLARGHPSLVQFLDYYQSEFLVYIVLECCDGGDLGHLIEAGASANNSSNNTNSSNNNNNSSGYVSEDFVASVAIQTLAALHYLHVDHHVLHRDMKPQNVFLLRDRWTVRLGDFGIAAVLGAAGQKAKEACGSPFYMAPELCEERAYGGEADVWSTGVMLYELAALQRPFHATTLGALTPLILKGRCVPLQERRGLPYSRELCDLIMGMLTVDAAARPTLRRLLRSAYVRQRLHTVPRAALDTPYYRDIFGAEAVAAALPKCLAPGIPLVTADGAASAAAATSNSNNNNGGGGDDGSDDYADDFED